MIESSTTFLTMIAILIIFGLLLGGMILVVVLVRSSNVGARVLGWILVASMAVVPLLMLSWFTVRTELVPQDESNRSKYSTQREFSAPPLTSSSTVSGRQTNETSITYAIWLPAVDREFKADVYPSQLAAARALGYRAGEEIQSTLAQEDEVSGRVLVQIRRATATAADTAADSNQINSTALQVIEQEIRGALPLATVQLVADLATQIATSEQDKLFTIEVTALSGGAVLSSDSAGAGLSSDFPPVDARRLQVKIEPTLSTTDLVATYVDKPWVEWASGFQPPQPDGRRRLVARSTRFANSQSEARTLATDAVTDLLKGSGDTEQISQGVRSGILVVDEFPQRLSRSYGDVWRHAILVDVTPARITSLSRQADQKDAKALSSLSGRLLGLVALILVATILYWVLNAVTRGYHRLPVAFVWATLVISIALAVILLRSTVG